MPGRDQTGPGGAGPMTGRRMGICSGASGGFFRGRGQGLGAGRGFRRGGRFGYAYPRQSDAYAENIDDLKNDEAALKDELKAVQDRISGLTGKKEEK